MSLPVKAGIGLVTVGTIGGVGYGIVAYSQDQGTEISKLIEKKYEYILLKTEGVTDNAHWTTNWGAYKTNGNNFFNLDNWDSLKSGDNPSELKKKCNELASKKILNKDDELYENVGKYCGRSVSIEDEAKKNKLTILKTDSTETGNTGDGPIWKKRHDIAKTTLKDTLSKLDVKQVAPTEQDIRNGCNIAKAKNKKDQKYKEIYDAYVKVCTKHKEDTEN